MGSVMILWMVKGKALPGHTLKALRSSATMPLKQCRRVVSFMPWPPLEKQTLVPTEQEAAWAPNNITRRQRIEKSLVPARN